MADTIKKQTIIDFDIQEQEAISSLANTKKAILDTKQAQKELNDAYKTGTVSLDQYAKESVQLEATLKKQQASYSTLQRTVTGLKNPFDKLNESIKDQAKQVTVAGISLSNFANPATGTIAVLTGLFKAYASSTIGAKDLTFASNQLSAATGLLANNFASLISSSKDGEGFFSGLLNSYFQAIGAGGLAAVSKNIAQIKEDIEDLQRAEISIRADNNERLEQNAELLAVAADHQKSIEDRLAATNQAVINLRTNESELLKVKEQQLEKINKLLAGDKENEDLQTAVLEKEKEISRVKSDIERKVQGILRAEQAIVQQRNEEAALALEEQQARDERAQEFEFEMMDETHEIKLQKIEGFNEEVIKLGLVQYQKVLAQREKDQKDFAKNEANKTKIKQLESQNQLATVSNAIGQGQALFEKDTVAYKFLGIARATIDTYRAADLALASLPPPFGAIAAGLNIALGLANVAKIVDVGLAAGGGSFYTKGPQLLMVGDNPGGVERVDVTPVSGRGKTVVGKNMIAMAGGGTAFAGVSAMGIDYSSMVNNQNIPSQQNIRVTMDYSEFTRFQNTVLYKEQVATA